MENKEYRVSVIIPTYERETKYLLRAIESILFQTYKNIETIIVDDNDPETEYRKRNIEFMKAYSDNPNIIYVLNPQNIGGALARNKGIDAASGDYITFLDDDDEYLPSKIEKQLEFMVSNDYDMTFTDIKLVNSRGVVVDYREHSKLRAFDKTTLLKYHIMRHLTGTPTFMYKTKIIRQIDGFDDVKVGQEFYLMFKTINSNCRIGYLDECDVIAYRHNEGGISQGEDKIIGEKTLYSFKKDFFHLFTRREKMFIRFRHYAVMAVAYKRNKKYVRAFINGVVMFMSSPIDVILEGHRFISKVYKERRLEYSNEPIGRAFK